MAQKKREKGDIMSDTLETAVRRVGNKIIIERLPKKMAGKTVSQKGLINAATEATSATVGGLDWGDIAVAIGITLTIFVIVFCCCCCCCGGVFAIGRTINQRIDSLESGKKECPKQKGLTNAGNQ